MNINVTQVVSEIRTQLRPLLRSQAEGGRVPETLLFHVPPFSQPSELSQKLVALSPTPERS